MDEPQRRTSLLSQKIVLWHESENINDYFTLDKELGRGHYGVVYACTDKATGEAFACKAISKNKLKTEADVELIRKEVMVMYTLLGVENCVQLKVTFEDSWHVYLVMELCSGGELFDRIVNSGIHTEQRAADIFRSMLKIIAACNSMGIMHRDIKPENFLMSDSSETATLKAADFGLSVFVKEGQTLTELAGTVDYMAPELINQRYGPEADVWSAGVIMYILLSGSPPFSGGTDRAIMDSIRRNKVSFAAAPWREVSDAAKDVIRRCLDKEPKRRISAEAALQHEWVREGSGVATDRALDPEVLSRMRTFAGMQRLKKLGLMLLVRHLKNEEVEGLRQLFLDMDADGSGSISVEELVYGMARRGAHVAREDLEALMATVDVQGDGAIDYEEFLAATVAGSKAASEDALFEAFAELDADGSGYVSAEELADKLSELGMSADPADIQKMIGDADSNNDGMIDYLEWLQLMSPGLGNRHQTAEKATESYKQRLAKHKSDTNRHHGHGHAHGHGHGHGGHRGRRRASEVEVTPDREYNSFGGGASSAAAAAAAAVREGGFPAQKQDDGQSVDMSGGSSCTTQSADKPSSSEALDTLAPLTTNATVSVGAAGGHAADTRHHHPYSSGASPPGGGFLGGFPGGFPRRSSGGSTADGAATAAPQPPPQGSEEGGADCQTSTPPLPPKSWPESPQSATFVLADFEAGPDGGGGGDTGGSGAGLKGCAIPPHALSAAMSRRWSVLPSATSGGGGGAEPGVGVGVDGMYPRSSRGAEDAAFGSPPIGGGGHGAFAHQASAGPGEEEGAAALRSAAAAAMRDRFGSGGGAPEGAAELLCPPVVVGAASGRPPPSGNPTEFSGSSSEDEDNPRRRRKWPLARCGSSG